MKTILMIGGGIQEVEAAKSVKASGYKLAITDRNENSPCRKYADYFLNFDGNDADGISEYIDKNCEEIGICGVFTLTELVITATKVASNFGLPSPSIESAIACQDKSISKEHWRRENIPTPTGGVFTSFSEVNKFFQQNSEVFVKPIEGFGGVGAGKINSNKALNDFFSKNDIRKYIIEEICEGPMIDVNGFFDENGRFNGLGCFEREFMSDKVIESQAFYPCQRGDEIVKEAYRLTEAACRALNITWGPVKSDLVLTKSGLKVFEVAPRLHGPKGTLYLTSFIHEKNHLEMILPLIIGEPFKVENISNSNNIAGFCLIDSPKKAFDEIANLDKLDNHNCKTLIFKNNTDSPIYYTSSADVIGYIFAGAESKSELIEILNKANNTIDFKNTL
jgi:biotin carboxylase